MMPPIVDENVPTTRQLDVLMPTSETFMVPAPAIVSLPDDTEVPNVTAVVPPTIVAEAVAAVLDGLTHRYFITPVIGFDIKYDWPVDVAVMTLTPIAVMVVADELTVCTGWLE